MLQFLKMAPAISPVFYLLYYANAGGVWWVLIVDSPVTNVIKKNNTVMGVEQHHSNLPFV